MSNPTAANTTGGDRQVGISPAYWISRYTDRFTPDQIVSGLPDVADMGFKTFQPEIFHRDLLSSWRNGGGEAVSRCSADLGLVASQFVAHFMSAAFRSPRNLASTAVVEDMKVVAEVVRAFDGCRFVTVPLPPFEAETPLGTEDYAGCWQSCGDRIAVLNEQAAAAGLCLALEILPGAIIGGIDGFLRLCDHLGQASLHLNVDTGHAWASKENLYLIPAKLGPRMAGTHLSDNVGHENLSLAPGRGSIDWPRFFRGLSVTGYSGAFDLEIICPPEQCREQYSRAREFIESLLTGGPMGPDTTARRLPC
jgi:sugar phosphate isomerase/epimerase